MPMPVRVIHGKKAIRWMACLGAVLTVGLMCHPLAQGVGPRFEFVSIRRVPTTCPAFSLNTRCAPEPPSDIRILPGGRLEATNQPVISLIAVAYEVEARLARYLSGGPSWVRNDRYDVIGFGGFDGPAGGATASESGVRDRLRTLLEERFRLRVRVVPKKGDAFALVRSTANLGPWLRPLSGTSTEGAEQAGEARDDDTRRGVSIAQLAQALSREVKMPVVDQTGLTGLFDATFQSASEEERRDVFGIVRKWGLALRPVGDFPSYRIEDIERPVED